MEVAGNLEPPWGRLYSLLPTLDSFDLVQDRLRVGRASKCDLIITERQFHPNQILNVSRNQFEIEKSDGIILIRDLSKNGTFVNDEKIGLRNEFVLQSNDVISLGHQILKAYKFMQLTQHTHSDFLPPLLRLKYTVTTILGQGLGGEVRLAYDIRTVQKFAIKRTKLVPRIPNQQEKIQTEIKILTELSHPFIIKMRELFQGGDMGVYIILEYMAGGELTSRILSKRRPLQDESEIKFIFTQIALGVKYLHEHKITHRDLKPQNVLLSSQDYYPVIKITDFGLSKVEKSHMETVCGTLNYTAPEILDKSQSSYDSRVDIWSLGVILYFMLIVELPFSAVDKKSVISRVLQGDMEWNHHKWGNYERPDDIKSLVRAMLAVDPVQRISLWSILEGTDWISGDHDNRDRVGQIVTSFGSNDNENDNNKRRKL